MPRLSLALHAGIERAIGRSLTWRLGRWLYLGSRRELINDPHLNGEYALQAWLLEAAAARGAPLVFIDVGANLGDWAHSLLETAHERGLSPITVHAFEPAPAQRQALARRLAPFASVSVHIDARGVGRACGRSRLAVQGEHAGSNMLLVDGMAPGEAKVVEVEITTLDEVCAAQGYERLFLVKVDTEGNDFNVIRGAARLFQQESIAVMQFEYNWRWIQFGYSLHDVFQFTKTSPYLIGKLTANGAELYEHWHPELDHYTETNYLLLHPNLLASVPHWWARFDRHNTLTGDKPRGRAAAHGDGFDSVAAWFTGLTLQRGRSASLRGTGR